MRLNSDYFMRCDPSAYPVNPFGSPRYTQITHNRFEVYCRRMEGQSEYGD